MQLLKIFLLFIFCILQYSLWFGKNGILNYINLYHDIEIIKKNNNVLKSHNYNVE
ncbi:cell division protein FtsB [Buchnera aphidicola]|uniref:cell division protein FtsB n=1 Tax=Buchnera aphidicola TaxID=9 RepID=UPI003BEF1F87